MVGRCVEIPYKSKIVKAATIFFNETVQTFKMI